MSQYFRPSHYLFEDWPSQTWRPTQGELASLYIKQPRWCEPSTSHPTPGLSIHPWPHTSLDPCNNPALPLPPAPHSCPLQAATCSSPPKWNRLFKNFFFLSFFFFGMYLNSEFLGSLTTMVVLAQKRRYKGIIFVQSQNKSDPLNMNHRNSADRRGTCKISR